MARSSLTRTASAYARWRASSSALALFGALVVSGAAVAGATRVEVTDGVPWELKTSPDLLWRSARAFASCSAVMGTAGAGAAVGGVAPAVLVAGAEGVAG